MFLCSCFAVENQELKQQLAQERLMAANEKKEQALRLTATGCVQMMMMGKVRGEHRHFA